MRLPLIVTNCVLPNLAAEIGMSGSSRGSISEIIAIFDLHHEFAILSMSGRRNRVQRRSPAEESTRNAEDDCFGQDLVESIEGALLEKPRTARFTAGSGASNSAKALKRLGWARAQ